MPSVETPQSSAKETAPCRTCIDFKSWSKQQRKALSTTSKPSDVTQTTNSKAQSSDTSKNESPAHCPLDKERLGRYTWGLLHTMAAYFPDNPTIEEQSNVRHFFNAFAKVYPCEYCAKDFQNELKDSPPETKSQHTLSQWLCRIHNKVNRKLGKPEFDCTNVNERWRDGPADGSCD
ncbi:FAD-linked sulfhydryl oxidase ALR [Toxorhynchites rutilus septentrionalis]|uniref:FAD-linked sulfhydryl oxidase ALR n=1 Tax=Toxorhynchites rutilus septentrionalis TaxID=329112 RepID=UPI00247A9CD9|nr:FAD-linked sulfhydryl oxidase ALR [Toxorhynchites rutilus septentrionalis]